MLSAIGRIFGVVGPSDIPYASVPPKTRGISQTVLGGHARCHPQARTSPRSPSSHLWRITHDTNPTTRSAGTHRCHHRTDAMIALQHGAGVVHRSSGDSAVGGGSNRDADAHDQLHHRQQEDHRPRPIEREPSHTELRRSRVSVGIVVETLAARPPRPAPTAPWPQTRRPRPESTRLALRSANTRSGLLPFSFSPTGGEGSG
jgi:hypothetical protein